MECRLVMGDSGKKKTIRFDSIQCHKRVDSIQFDSIQELRTPPQGALDNSLWR